jgi:hypothetical protein
MARAQMTTKHGMENLPEHLVVGVPMVKKYQSPIAHAKMLAFPRQRPSGV